MKRLAKILATVVLLALDLLLLAYVLRRPLFEAHLRELVERELSAVTGCEVRIGAIEGNWLTEIRVLGVQLRGGPDAFLQRVDGLDLTASVAPLQLLAGDLSGLRAARAVARHARLDTGGGFPPGGEIVEGEDAAVPDLTRLLPEGALVRIHDLTLGTGDAWRSGPLSVFFEPGTGRRHLRLEHPGLVGRFSVEPAAGELPTVDGHVQVEEAGPHRERRPGPPALPRARPAPRTATRARSPRVQLAVPRIGSAVPRRGGGQPAASRTDLHDRRDPPAQPPRRGSDGPAPGDGRRAPADRRSRAVSRAAAGGAL